MFMRALILGGVGAALLAASPVYAFDVCGLASKGEAAAALGLPVAVSRAVGPDRDETSGGQLTYCTYRAPKADLLLSVVEFSSPAAARKLATAQFAEGSVDKGKVIAESGIGERTFWVVSSQGGGYLFLKGSRVVQVSGMGNGQGASRKAALYALARAIAKKL
jgi:hypothetical protein